MLLVAFGIKAAIFPLSAWLPDSYPTAPAPVTAVFAGLLTKVGVYAIIRTQVLLFPDGRLDGLLMWLALATMIVGILGAVAQEDIKRLLSFTLVSHIGYMIWGIGTASAAGLSAAIFYVAHHITVQTSLFLVAGLIERRGGTTSLVRLGSLARLAPLLAVLFFIPAMNLAGIPPMTGFLGKTGLIEAAAQAGHAAGLRPHRRRARHLPAHPVRHHQDVEHGVLAGGPRAPAGDDDAAGDGRLGRRARRLLPGARRPGRPAVRLHRPGRGRPARPHPLHQRRPARGRPRHRAVLRTSPSRASAGRSAPTESRPDRDGRCR